jgi:hypothetical protein
MKKILIPFIILFVFISSVFSQQVIKNDLHKFQMTFPDDCKVSSKTTGLIVLIAKFSKSGSINVTVRDMDTVNEGTSDGYNFQPMADSISSVYKVLFSNYTETESAYIGISENIFYRIVYNFEMMKKKFWGSQYLTAKFNKMYIITLSCFADDYAKNKLDYNECLSSFKFLE